jgi:putative phage-type endonuclease
MTTATDHPDGWHERRRKGIGSSDIAGILGISPWATPYTVWTEKMGHGSPGSERMRWGNLLENVVLDEAARRLGFTITGRQVEARHREAPHALATLDAVYAVEPGEPEAGALEAKTTGGGRWDGVPVHYEAQVQWQLEMRDLPVAWVACLHSGQKLTLWKIERDPDIGQGLIAVAERFWRNHVETGIPPAVDGSPATAGAIARRYEATVPELAADLGTLAPQLDRLREIRAEQDALKTERGQLENEIKAFIGAAEAGQVNGETAVTWRAQTSRRIDVERLRDEHPDIAEQYTISKSSRRLLLKTPGGDNDEQ